MIDIKFDSDGIDQFIQQAVRQQLAETLASVVCPAHGKRLETVHIVNTAPDQLQLYMSGCCDEVIKLANDALGASGDESDVTQDTISDEAAGTLRSETPQAATPRPLRAFICHASEDKALARKIAFDLHAAGIDTFFDEWEIKAGDSLRQKIDEGLAACTHFIVLLTPRSLHKPWVNAELDAGFVKKVNGQAILIPLRVDLAAAQLPPLVAAMSSPEIVDYEHDIKRIGNEIRGITRKPPVAPATKTAPAWGPNLALSPLAAEIAELFAKRSEHGRAWDPQLDIEDIRSAVGGTDDDLIEAITELVDLRWVKPLPVIGAAPFGYRIVTPTDQIFVRIDPHVMPWDPVRDAVRVSAEILNSGNNGLASRDLTELLGWSPRRLNPALTYLLSQDLITGSSAVDPVFVTPYVLLTPRTRRFVREQP